MPLDRRRRNLCVAGAALACGGWLGACRPSARAMSFALDFEMISGRSRGHLGAAGDASAANVAMHPDAAAAFARLRAYGAAEGIDLRVISGFRSFERQLRIWNDKARGRRPVYDDDGVALRLENLPPARRPHAILRFSALPGGSRHHWGSDVDIYDAAAVGRGYRVRLDQRESAGVFAGAHRWLDRRFAAGDGEGFYRPYDGRGGIGAEPWHLSWRPLAARCEALLRPEALAALIESAEIELKREILADFDAIYRDYIGTYFQNA